MDRILIVVDMQNDFISGSLGTKEAAAAVERAVSRIAQWDGPVYATQDTHGEDYLQTQEGKKLPVPHCQKGTEGWKLHDAVMTALREKDWEAVEKPAFGSRILAERLLERWGGRPEMPEEIRLIGLCTDICVISNALLLKSFFPETKITVEADCCAGVTPESHQRALEAMAVCQIDIIENR